MLNPQFSDSTELLKTVLAPLLEDFTYWFGRSRTLLEQPQVHGLDTADRQNLLHRVCEAQTAVQTTKVMMQATDSQAGIDTDVLMTWHHLVTECWQVAMRHRAAQSATGSDHLGDTNMGDIAISND